MENSTAEIYLKEKIAEHLRTTSAFHKQVQSDLGALQLIRQEVMDIKSNKGEKGFEECKGKLIKLQEVHYNMFLLDQSVKHLQGVIHELSVMAKVLKVEIEIPDEAKEYFGLITSTNPMVFAVENGKPVMIKSKITDDVMGALDAKIKSEEGLKTLYESL